MDVEIAETAVVPGEVMMAPDDVVGDDLASAETAEMAELNALIVAENAEMAS